MTVRVTARRTETGVYRFDIWHTPALRPTYTFLGFDDTYRLLAREPSLNGCRIQAISEAILAYESEIVSD